jgi:flagellar assembly protein FliH
MNHRPFTFDDFDEIDRKIVELRLVESAPPPPSFSEEELAAAKQQAYGHGVEIGRREVETGLLQQVAGLTAAIEVHLSDLSRQEAKRDAAFERDAVALALAMFKKLAPSLAAKGALDEVERLLNECMAERHDEPRLVVRVHDSMLEALQTRVAALTDARHFGGKIVLLSEPNFAPSDIRVEWADGGAERRVAAILAAIERLTLESIPTQPS